MHKEKLDYEQLAVSIVKTVLLQMMAFSSAIIVLTITFLKDITPTPNSFEKTCYSITWIFHFTAITFGLWSLMALAGSLNKKIMESSVFDIFGTNIKYPAIGQIVSFIIGIFAMLLLGASALNLF